MPFIKKSAQKIKQMFLAHLKLSAFILGIFSVQALPPFYAFFVLFITFPLLFIILNYAQNKKQSFQYGYWFGFGYFACNMSWIGNALLIDIEKFGWLYPIVLLASGGFFGLFVGIPSALSFYFKNIYARWLSFSAFWVIFEWIRSFIFTGFPWNLLGSSLAFSDILIQPASVFGTYGLSLFVLLNTMVIALPILKQDKKSVSVMCVLLLCSAISFYTFGKYRLNNSDKQISDVVIRLVQPSIPQSMKWNQKNLEKNFAEYIKLSTSKSLTDVDFVVWGETASPFPLDFEPQYLQQITQAIPPQGYLITGSVRFSYKDGDFRPLNSMFIINKSGKIIDYYDKSHLVPFGEYIPFRKYLPEWVRPITQTINDFLAGNGPKKIEITNYPSFGGLICYEVIFPHQIINPNNPPQWIVNLTNDGWYGVSQGPYQHLVTTRLRAVEEGISIVRVANTGISALINAYGQTMGEISLNQSAILDVNLPKISSVQTPYKQFGNMLPLILCICNILLALVFRK